MLKNKKGFTLIEILAAVTILGILTAIAIVSVTKIIEKAKKEHYITVENNVISAAQSYAQQNRSVLPKAIGQTTKVKLKTLTDSKYINEVLDYSKNECDLEESYVQIFKYTQKDYSYLTYLKCPGYTSDETISGLTPHITITFNSASALDTEKAMADITILGSDPESVKLMSYNYKIYRATAGAGSTEITTELKNSGDISAAGKTKVEIDNLSLEDYTPGKIKIAVTATNIYGMTKTISATEDFKDNKKPKCVIKEEDKITSPKEWIKADRKITIGCDDGEGSGCVRTEYSKTFKDTMKNGKIRITDNSGNYTDCQVSVYIDKTAPTVPTTKLYNWKNNSTRPTNTTGLTTYTSNKWTNINVYIKPADSTDEGSGTIEYQYKTTGDTQNFTNKIGTEVNITEEGTSKIQWRACDILGNCSEYSEEKTIKLDKTAPTKPNINMYKWTNNSTRPTSSSGLSSYTNDTWSNKSIFTQPSGSTDNLSGVKEYQFTTTGVTANKSDEEAEYRNIEAEGISYIKWKACDNAGNCSSYTANKTIKIDKTEPGCTVSGGSTTWINASSSPGTRVITAHCTDSGGSGCATADFSYTYSTDIKTTTAGAKGNNAGGSVMDGAGNETPCPANQTVKIDKTAPTQPNINMYKWTNNSTRPTSSSGLSSYTNDTWSNKSIFTQPSGSTDNLSGVKEYQFTTTGVTANKTNEAETYRNIEAEGTSYIKWRSCDNAGNCSSYTSNKTIKIDKTAPGCEVSGGSTTWINATSSPGSRVIKAHCTDSGSGCATADFTHTYSTNINTTKAGAKGDNNGGTVKDVAGNETTCAANQTVKIDKTAPGCTVSGGSTTWVNASSSPGTRVVKAQCTDSGGSGCATADFSHTYSTDISTTTAGAKGNNNGGTVKDVAGNETSCSANQTVKIDKTAPSVPTINMYKWTNNSTRPTSSSGLSSYANNTWSNKSIFTQPSGSTDNLSGVKEYQFTTTGVTANKTNEAETYRSIEAEGTSYIKWRSCDNAGNCSSYTSNNTIKIDKTAPGCTVSGGSTTWINASSSPGTRVIKAHCTDSGSGCITADFTHTYSTDISTTKAGAKGDNNGGTVKDAAGNETTCAANQTVKIDKTAPSVPTINMYKWTNNSTSPSSTSGLSSYANNTWSNRNIYTTPSGSTDNLSGLKEYQYTTTGVTENNSNTAATYRNVKAEGTSYIKWRSCDNAGNCSSYTSNNTIKIDKTAPGCEVSGGSTTWINATSSPGTRVIKAHCTDSGSGCATADFTHTYSTNINTTKAGAKGDNNGGTVKDVAGNETACAANQTVKIDKTAPTCSSSGGSATWTNSNKTITGTCSDTGGSGCTGNVTKTYSTNTDTTSASPGTVKDNAGNSATCPANQTIKIDKTAPTCSSSGGSTTWTNASKTLTGTCSDTGGSGCAGNTTKTYSTNTNTTTASPGTVKDNAGNSTTCPANQTVKIDKTAPTCTSGGGSGTWTNSSVILIGLCNDTGGSGCTGNITRTLSSNTNSGSQSPGTVYDNAGNSAACPANQTVKIDKTPPSCSNSGGSATWTNSNKTITGTCTDSGGSGCTGNATKSYTSNTNITNASPGTVYDNAGNSATCPSDQTVRIDKTAPTCSSSGGNSNWTNGNRTLTGTCSDTGGSGCTGNTTKTYSTNTNTTTASAGTVYDYAGNSATCSANQTVKIDKSPPTCTSGGGGGTWTNSSVILIGLCSDTGGSGCTGNITRTLSSNTNSSYESPGTVYDYAGNSATCSANQTVKIDKTPPSCSNSGGSTTWTNANKTITGTCSDTGGSGCAGNATKSYTTNTNTTTASPGTVKDNAGNSTVCPSDQTVKIDKTAPSCTSSGGNSNWTNGNRTLTGTCTDSGGSGCVGNATKTISTDTNTTTASPGKVKDNAGNETTCPSNQTVKIDKTAPTCTNSGGSSSWTNGSITITGTCSDTGSGCTGNATKTYSTNTNSSYESPGTVYDNAGNSKVCSSNQTVKIDKTPPTCTSGGGSSTWTNGSRTLVGTCSDTGGSGCVSNAEKIYTANKNSTTETPGRVRDFAGNYTECPSNQTVRIDKTAPTCTNSGGSSSWTNGSITITGTCSDSGSGCVGNVTKTYSTNTNSTTESPGTVKDNAGNTTVCTSDRKVKIDKTAPTCTSSGGSSTWTNGSRTLVGTCNDSGGSGCESSRIEKIYSSNKDSTSESPGTVKDKAGNTKACPSNQTVKIDKTAPKVTLTMKQLGHNTVDSSKDVKTYYNKSSYANYTSGTNYNGGTVLVWTNPEDALSGIASTTCTVSGAEADRNPDDFSGWRSFFWKGTTTIKCKTKDKAGNTSAQVTAKVVNNHSHEYGDYITHKSAAFKNYKVDYYETCRTDGYWERQSCGHARHKCSTSKKVAHIRCIHCGRTRTEILGSNQNWWCPRDSKNKGIDVWLP